MTPQQAFIRGKCNSEDKNTGPKAFLKAIIVITAVPLHHSHYFTEELKALQLDKERRDVINATYFPVNMPQVEFLSIPLDDGYGMF